MLKYIIAIINLFIINLFIITIGKILPTPNPVLYTMNISSSNYFTDTIVFYAYPNPQKIINSILYFQNATE